MNKEMKEFFGYVRKENIMFKELVENYEEAKNDFLKADRQLKHKKEELYNSKNINISKWELSPEDEDVISSGDKELIFSKMLPRVNFDVILGDCQL
jgi:hypothetical protein